MIINEIRWGEDAVTFNGETHVQNGCIINGNLLRDYVGIAMSSAKEKMTSKW